MNKAFANHLAQQLDGIRAAGTYKRERVIATPQGTMIRVADGRPVLNLCANNYLGLAQHPEVRAAAHAALDEWGYGCASVRFICGTQGVHRQLERALSDFLGTEDTILYSSCFDANGGLFETLLGAEDAIISDELNHASIIDGIRLCKAQRLRYANNNMTDLAARLVESAGARFRMIATDGVFSMDGYLAKLDAICDLAERHGIRPTKALGQNFLVDPNLARAIADLAGAAPGVRVVEVGAGLGSLTVALADAGASVLAIEFDRNLVPALREVAFTRSLERITRSPSTATTAHHSLTAIAGSSGRPPARVPTADSTAAAAT